MRPSSSSYFLPLLWVILLPACDDHTVQPSEPEIRAEKLTHHFAGGLSYRILQYDDQGKVITLVSGVTYPDEGSFENVHDLIYEGNRLKEIQSRDNTIWSFQYTYGKKGELTETGMFVGDSLKEFHAYSYDTESQLISDITWRDSGEKKQLIPVTQYLYAYNGHHNLIETRQFIYQEDAFQLATTITYHDFDDKVNPEYLFLNNLHHPTVRFFRNNPRLVRLMHENGTGAEQIFSYEYNSHGHVTKRRIENDPSSIDFEYADVK